MAKQRASATNINATIPQDIYDDIGDMSWIQPEYSRKEVARAGKVLRDRENATKEEYDRALEVAGNWRSAHACPLNAVRQFLAQRCKNRKDVLLAQRLKRMPSIIGKLRRLNLKLSDIQDIGGCRVVVNTIDDIRNFEKVDHGNFQHILKKTDDYIANPKKSGYRGIHQIYKYRTKNENSPFNNLLIEVQLRTFIQHAWATSVEICGAFTGQNLKSGQGDEEWLDFFRKSSILLADWEEENESVDFLRKEVKAAEQYLRVINKLSTFSRTMQFLEEHSIHFGKNDNLILEQRIPGDGKPSIKIEQYSPKHTRKATMRYLTLEAEYEDDKTSVYPRQN